MYKRGNPTKLNPWTRVVLAKLTGFQVIKKFAAYYGTRRFITAYYGTRRFITAYYGTRRFITAFTRARHLSSF
jgi:hypothetical protein